MRLTIRYWPLLSLTPARTFSISTGLAASIVTPGSTAPELSLTVPEIEACANTDAGSKSSHDSPTTIRCDAPMRTLLVWTGRFHRGRDAGWARLPRYSADSDRFGNQKTVKTRGPARPFEHKSSGWIS